MDKKTELRLAAAMAIDEFAYEVMSPTYDDYFWDQLDRYVSPDDEEEARREAFAITYQNLDATIESKFWEDWEEVDLEPYHKYLYVKMVNAIDAYIHPAITWRELRDAINALPDEVLDSEVVVDADDDDARGVRGIAGTSTLMPAISLA